MNVNKQTHLSTAKRINLGSFYTPRKFVRMASEWLKNGDIDEDYVIADLSCGYGAFFELSYFFPNNKYIGNDIDTEAVDCVPKNFQNVELYNLNVFESVCRSRYGIEDDGKLIIVGNPPYNDVTSQINASVKKSDIKMDIDIKTRDLGMSSLLVYSKLEADYVLVLHPLSYLIKKANFYSCRNFFSNYSIVNHIVFSSQEFSNTSKFSGFPIIMALYKRNVSRGLTYEQVRNFSFNTLEGVSFVLSDRDYVADYIEKYPTSKRYEPEILFYTLRDINALKRSRTFIKIRVANAVDVDPEKLSYYCYIDCFKDFAEQLPYFMGNFDIPFIKNTFNEIKDDLMEISYFKHQDIFGKREKPDAIKYNRVKKYIQNVLTYSKLA